MTPLEDAFRLLEQARQTADPAALAQALVNHASTLGDLGYFAEARTAMDEAAALRRQLGQPIDECMCMQFAAVFSRLAGDLAGAHNRAAYSLQVIPADHPLTVSALREIAEAAFAGGDGVKAADRFTEAINQARKLALPMGDVGMLLDRRARAFLLAGLHDDALADLEVAQQVAASVGEKGVAMKLLTEQATLLHTIGRLAAAKERAEAARVLAVDNDDPYAIADVALLHSAIALDDEDLDSALEAALAARRCALQAVAPHIYVAAALAIGELYDILGNRLAAYEALAVGYVTLADLLGEEMSNATFTPKLLEKREKWGAAAFESIKAEYEAERRAAQA
jgi:tetratricopeptide (TPR) repeat protein